MILQYSRRRALLPVAILLAIASHCSFTTADDDLGKRIDAVIDAAEFKHAHWGVLAVDMDSGATLYERAADKLFAPASTTKLYSVAAALDEFGADYCFETPVYATAEVDKDGRLAGNLVLVASGDLNMGGRTDEQGHIAFVDSDHTYANFSRSAEITKPNPLAGLDEMARQIAAAGIKHVEGDVLVDDRLFQSAEGTGSGPGRLTPIIINDNVIDVRITPTRPGELAKAEWRPQTAAVRVDVQVDTVAAKGETHVDVQSPEEGVVIVDGQIPAEAKPLVRIHEVTDAASFARSLLIEALRRADVRVEASPLDSNDDDNLPENTEYATMQRVALLKSPPFSEAAKLILKVSHNLHASTLPLLLAARHDERTLSAGLRLQHNFLARVGVDVDSISFGGGAGGDRADYTTPRTTVQLLRYMATRPDFEEYRQALPILGVDGTLASSVGKDSPARGKVQAKTGTLVWSNVMNGTSMLNSKALAGYATTAAGRRVALAMFVNQVQIHKPDDREHVGQVLGKVCEEIVKAK
ncbi:MAG TPA: D-alanyl-D-alanine carboxypeptidase/D-alanyl-D-alanine-endopeptidase [Pirellulales bacterium]|jgi:D-alanyl-D-alanine carboxypeptidase/D-alanyl-D-alanine-endopeptidase (penicillin-binding protein 4)